MSAQIRDLLKLDLKVEIILHNSQSPDYALFLLEFALAYQKTQ